ncbi:flagellar hook-associated protein 1 FlgK [Cohaesibacter sp. ES.047]|uniref:flagellar hook-associated protein FlgK n=1 Tax=Cohaesibacter sp. ES.047 TaxID=1798205 RepID=UPI000BB68A76|nr:flagellar hook-associated protein FlgK [Cohaesibacter sp. ES.047]SNY94288.1 flagellar hook-associated protein 1 FlgK [Cohaesibacter sp. ES.047]
MALKTALSIAQSGLRTTNRELEIVASNVTNANTVGYTRKVVNREEIVLNGDVTSVLNTDVRRSLDLVAQKQYWTETAATNYTGTINNFLQQVDAVFGTPGDGNALDSLVNDFAGSLQALQTTPDDASSRLEVLNSANVLTQRMNEASQTLQELRQNAEMGISDAIDQLNSYLTDIQTLDKQIQTFTQEGDNPAGLMDQRDQLITRMAELVPVRVQHGKDNSVSISLGNGLTVYDQAAAEFEFTANGAVAPQTEWDSDPAISELGSIYLKSNTGALYDVTKSSDFTSGEIGALLELRDDLLVEAQNQLDNLADGMADAFSKYDVEGTAATSGLQAGFDVDLGAMQSGDEITLSYEDVGTGQTHVVTFVRVDSATSLPLGDDVTARNDDTVYGIDFSGGMASVAAQIQTALGGAFTASNPSGNSLQILDDGAANTVNVLALDASVTATGLQDRADALPFFVDGGEGPGLYTGSVDGQRQQTGFAGRISVNPDLIIDQSLLVKYGSGIGEADQTRPEALYNAMTDEAMTFGYQTGGAPITMTVDEYARQFITYQAEQASAAQTRHSGQEIVMNNVQARFEDGAKVDVDTELANLLELQTAYSANARVMTAVKEMMDALLRI